MVRVGLRRSSKPLGERSAQFFSTPNATLGMAGFLHLPRHVELLVLTATLALSIGLGLAMTRATIFMVLSLMTRNMSALTHGLAYENHTIPYASHAAE